jgi:hypothetical protein
MTYFTKTFFAMKNYKIAFIFFLLIVLSFQVMGQKTWNGGNWNVGGNWTPAGVPITTDNILIAVGATCTVNVSPTCNSISFNVGAGSATVNIAAGQTLTVTNQIDLNGPGGGMMATARNNILNIATGTVTCGSLLVTTEGNGDNRDSNITISTGTLNVAGNLTMSADPDRSNITFTGTGTINVGGAANPCFQTGVLTTVAGSTVNYNRAGDQTISTSFTGTYNNLTISGSGIKSLQANTNINGNLTINNGTLNLAAFTLNRTAAGGTFAMAANTTLLVGGAANFPSNYTTTTLNATSTVNYNMAGNQNVNGVTYGNLSITGDNTKNLQGATIVSTLLTIQNTLGGTAPTLELGTQNLTVNGNTVITGAPVTAYGGYGAGNGAFLNDGNATGTNTFVGLVTLNLNGNWNTTASNTIFQGGINNSGRSFLGGTANLNGTQTISGGSITRFNGNITISAASTITNTGFVYAAGTLEGAAANVTWTNIGFLKYDNGANLMTTGTLNASADYNTVDYICNCAQVVKDIDYYNLTVSNSTKTMAPTATRNVNGMLSVRTATFTVSTIKLDVKLATIGINSVFNNTSTATAGTTTNFNQNSAFTGKFDVINASNHQDSYVYSNNGSDVVLQRGEDGGVYAVKTTNFTAAPTQFVAQFEIEAKSRTNDVNAATLLLGDGFTNDLTRNGSTARLQFNFSGTTTGYSITHPDGAATTSAVQDARQTVTWVVNRGGGVYNYTDPLGRLFRIYLIFPPAFDSFLP